MKLWRLCQLLVMKWMTGVGMEMKNDIFRDTDKEQLYWTEEFPPLEPSFVYLFTTTKSLDFSRLQPFWISTVAYTASISRIKSSPK